MKFNSKNLLIFLAVIVFVAFAYFAVYSKKSSVSSPNNNIPTPSSEVESESGEVNVSEISLEITSPKDGEVVTKSPVLVTGTTIGGADVFVNDAETKADEDGNFKVSISLDEGENEIFVTANDQDGNYTESSIKVSLNTE